MPKVCLDESRSQYETYTKDDYAILIGEDDVLQYSGYADTYLNLNLDINYPNEFNINNTCVISFMYKTNSTDEECWINGTEVATNDLETFMKTGFCRCYEDRINLRANVGRKQDYTNLPTKIAYKLVLMKIS